MTLASAAVSHGTCWRAGVAATAVGAKPAASSTMIPPDAAALASVRRDR
ncbi:MAG: hypothetical protein ABSA53_26600 [Streptosporangiaceae bacterium]